MSDPIQLTGGGFQDCTDQPISNGWLEFELNADGVVNTTVYICSTDIIIINLDDEGNVITDPSQVVWPNDQITPSGTFYKVTGYGENGQWVWGPNYVQVFSSPSPFNINAWIPSNPG